MTSQEGMTSIEFLASLRRLDVQVWADGDRLRTSAPKGVLTPSLRHELTTRKAEILALLRHASEAVQAAAAPIQPVSRAGDLPLSFVQQRLWFLEHFDPGLPLYHISRRIDIKGNLTVRALEHSLNEIIRRHEALRTTFVTREGRPVQVIHPSLTLAMPIVDLRTVPDTERHAEIRRLAVQEAQRPFDLSHGPLLRTTLFVLGEDEHVLVLTLHHIVTDGWSMGVFFRELGTLYEMFCHGTPSPLAALPVQYADVAHWQRQYLQGEILERHLSYWKQQLDGLAVLELPTDRPRPAVQSHQGALQPLELPKRLFESLKALSQQEGVTLFMVLFAAFQVLLHRYSGQHDIVVGVPVAGRTRKEMEGLIGCFVNTLALRVDVSGKPSFKAFLRRVREVSFDAYAHQELPFEKLVEALQPARDLRHAPLCQVMFSLQNVPRHALKLSRLSLNVSDVPNGTSACDLTLLMEETAQDLGGVLAYNTALFEASTIERMIGHFETLLYGIVANPDQRVTALPLLRDTERHQILTAWNDTQTSYPRERCIHELFETQVRRTPEAIAVVFEEKSLTYHALNTRANRLAHYLRRLGVGPETLVGLCVARSLEMVVGLLGILKAGGAYVPLDPSYPRERLAFMVEDTQAPVVLTQQALVDALPVDGQTVICLDAPWPALAQETAEPLGTAATSGHLAYVMYTSGSTGKPKGVSVTHRNVVRLVIEPNYAQLSADEVFLQFAPLAFDAATLEIWGPLLNGGRLVVFPPGLSTLKQLGETVQQQQITTLWLTAGLFHHLVDQHVDCLRGLRQLLSGGDVLSVAHVQTVLEALPECQLINGYGPTENTTFTTCHRFPAGASVGSAVPIGRPISNTQVYVLDEHLEPVPIGTVGELYTGGDGLARGYLNRPALTAERFIPHPFSAEPGARLYKTGDLARYQPDGNIEFLGRIDHQVKLRGFRIELGEIETVLRQHPGVRDTVVLVRESPSRDKQLVAYMVAKAEMDLRESELREYVRTRLPEYMVPSVFMTLDQLPLTRNGKVDRRALPTPDRKRPTRKTSSVAPRTPLEETLAGIWTEVLGFETIGIHDNFFTLGGHSLLSMQVVSRLSAVMKRHIPVNALFSHPSIAALAGALAEDACVTQGTKDGYTPTIRAVPRSRNLPLSFAQQRLWFLEQFEPGLPMYHIAHGLELQGDLQVRALEQSLNDIVRRHEVLRTTFATTDGEPVQVIHPHMTLELPIVDLWQLPETERDAEAHRWARQQAGRPFDLSQGPLVRSILLRLRADQYVLVLTMHHIISDGWSMAVLLRELEALYNAFVAGAPSPLAALPIQYADFAQWQRQWLQGETLQSHLSYWQTQLAGIPARLELPTDWPRPTVQTHRGGRYIEVLPQALTEALKALSHQQGVTLFMTLLAAFKTLLYRYTEQEHIVVGTPIAGRNRVEMEGLIGFFVNTLVLHTDLSGDPTFRTVLDRVREVALGAFAHQELPFEKLVEVLQPERDVSQNPLFQVWFNMINLEANAPCLHGITAAPFIASEPASKFDMTLYVNERQSTLHVQCVYNAALFSEARMHEMLAQFRELLWQLVEDPDRRLSSYSLVTAEAREILPDPRLRLSEPYYEPVTHWFTNWAQRAPRHAAVIHGAHLWTYETLAQRAETLARTLVWRGVAPQDVVAVRMLPSFGTVVSMLGVLMSGGVFLLIDPDLPSERQELLCREAKARYLIETASSVSADAGLAMSLAVERLVLDATTGCLEAAAVGTDVVVLPRLAPDDAAYIFFTSGSTGVPKGVLGCHKGLSHFVQWQADTFDVGPDDRVAQLTRLSFDPVLRDVFLPLTRGATLCIPETYGGLGPYDLVRWLAQERITMVHTVPTLAQIWLADMPGNVPCPDLRWVFFSGEALIDTLVHQWRALFPGCDVVNFYGPTETTMIKGFYEVPQDVRPGVQPIGSPMPQTQLLVFTPDKQLCGIGEPGEIVIRTPFRSLGYVNASEKDRQRFAVNPFGHDTQDVVYYTGDRGRYRPDGTLEIMGRLDDQVKIRGVRVEPGEVTATLSHHPAVQACAVVARKQAKGQACLVAYVVTAKPEGISVPALRSHLVKHLPLVMIPAAFVLLDALPLTATGKVDLRALPEPAPVTSAHEAAYDPPRSALEQTLAGLWAALLGIERVGRYDNFFALGGHSLLAMQVVSRLRHHVDVDVPLRTLFQVPTLAALAEQIEVLRQAAAETSGQPLGPVPRDGAVPLSFAQQRLWFLHQFKSGSALYHMSHAFRLQGALNRTALTQSLTDVVQRHEALRTTFVIVDEEPMQIIMPCRPVEMPCVDLRGLPEVERDSELQRLAREVAQRPFDLRCDVLLRATLWQVAEDEHVLLLVMHHIASDGWSVGIILRELSALYNAFNQGQPSPLPPLPIQYADFAIWQRQWLQGPVLEHQLAYWKRQLGEAPAALEFPTDTTRPAVQTHRGAMREAILPTTLVTALEAFSHKEHVTVFMTLLAALQVLLYRITGQEDLVVGAPIAGRNHPAVEGLIGFFLNTLALRTTLAGHVSFQAFLAHVREVTLEAYNHQDIPFEKLLQELPVVRDVSRTPLFQVFLNMLDVEQTQLELHGLTLEPRRLFDALSKFDMTFYVRKRHGHYVLRLVYNADLFRPERMTELLAQFQHLLWQVVEHPDQPLTSFSLVTPMAQKLLPNPTQALCADWHGPVHAAVSRHAQGSPQHLAVVDAQDVWTYADLEARSNQLAHYLRAHGIQSRDIVAIYAHRSASLVWAVLGVLKAGAAFVMLDPAYPAERLMQYLQATQPRGLLQLEAAGPFPDVLEASVETFARACRLRVPRQSTLHTAAVLETYDTEPPDITIGPDDLACVAFTSGSTGQPKGVLGRHGPLSHFLPWQVRTCALRPADRFSMVSSLSHDPLQRDIFTTLWVGGTVYIPPSDTITTSGQLAQWMAEHAITFAHLTPPLCQLLTETAAADSRLPALRYVFFVGDALTRRDVDHVRRLAPQVTCIHSYGATETQRAVGYALIPPEAVDVSAKAVYPLRQEMPDVQLLVVHATGQMAGIGELGEIWVRSPHLAQGYLDDASLTQARFIPNPFTHDVHDRVYKTGDMGRYLPNGAVEYVGRTDHQVKIRGFRLELGEIAAVLGQHPAVHEVVVRDYQTTRGDTRLVAYVVPTQTAGVSPNELRGFLKRKLPEYMLPSAFVPLQAIPLTPNGKVDHQALPAPEMARLDLETAYVASRTSSLEETLTGIWSEVLGLEHIGIHDNFFALGGHSLLAMQLVSKMSRVMHRDISIQTLFTYQTIAELLDAIAAEASETHDTHDASASSDEHIALPEETKGTSAEPASPYVTIERRPLLPLFVMGKLPPIDAAALGCLSSELLVHTGLSRDQIVAAWCDHLPTLRATREMPLGRIATIMLPRFRSELYDDQGALVEEIIEALQLAGRLGAKIVALTGLIPSATDYGRAVLRAIGDRQDVPQVSTGHATTAATVVLAIERIVRAAGRNLRQERVGFLGLGSIGQTTLHLMLQCLPHPRELLLCDVYSKLDDLAHIRRQLATHYGFQGEILTCGSGQDVPPEFYTSSLMVGATNVPELIDIARVRPGTILVDDSAPHCFAVDAAVERIEAHGDILFTEGGVLRSPYPIHQRLYVSASMQQMLYRANRLPLASNRPYQITGCVLSGLLSACFEHLKPTVGMVDDDSGRQHYERLSQLGFQAAELHCGRYVLSETTIRNFQQRFAGLALEDFES